MNRALALLAIYALLTIIGLHAHELFLDEAHHFLLARDSSSLADLYYNARYDGHPRLWHTLLFVITHALTTDPAAMQVLQGLISISVAFVFLRYAPFTLPVKIGVLFGYYLLFEYNLLSRNYALGLLFLFIVCTIFNSPRRRLLPNGLLMVLMCNTHVFFTFASIGIYCLLFLQYAQKKALFTKPFVVFTGLFLFGFACALVQARVPQVDNVNLTPIHREKWLSGGNFGFAAFGFIRGWLPVPPLSDGHFWNHYWLSPGKTGPFIGALMFLFFLGFPALVLWRRRPALLFYYACAGLLFVFFDVTQMTAARYFGMVFILFLAAAWLSAAGQPGTSQDALAGINPIVKTTFFAILAIHMAIGAYAYGQELTRPFSQSRNTARYLQSLPAGETIAVDGYNCGPMLCAYLRGKLFYLATGTEGSFCVWKSSYFPNPRPTIGQELARWPDLLKAQRLILVANRPLTPPETRIPASPGTDIEDPHFQLIPLRSFVGSIQGENYYVYQVNTEDRAGIP
jgi:hypothetical protein